MWPAGGGFIFIDLLFLDVRAGLARVGVELHDSVWDLPGTLILETSPLAPQKTSSGKQVGNPSPVPTRFFALAACTTISRFFPDRRAPEAIFVAVALPLTRLQRFERFQAV